VIGWTTDAPFAGAAKTGAGGAFDDGGVGVGFGCPFFASACLVSADRNKRKATTNTEDIRLIIFILDTRAASRRSTGQL